MANPEHGPVSVTTPLFFPPGFNRRYGDYKTPTFSSDSHPALSSGGMHYDVTTRQPRILERYSLTLQPQVVGEGKTVLEQRVAEADKTEAMKAVAMFYRHSQLHSVEVKSMPEEKGWTRAITLQNDEKTFCTVTAEGIQPDPGDLPYREVEDETGYTMEVLLPAPLSLDPNNSEFLHVSVGIQLASRASYDRLVEVIEEQLRQRAVSEEVVRTHINAFTRLMLPDDSLLEEFRYYDETHEGTFGEDE